MEDELDMEAEMPTDEPELGAEESEDSEAPGDEFDMEADAALNTALPMSERRAALKNAIMACMGTDYGAEKEKQEGGDMFASLLGES